ncbi:MAG: DUF2231 domain-containing protein [Mycobacteriaceae bacterium]
MSTLNGLPAHILLVHFIVVLAPLTAILAVICAAWPAARKRLVWLVLALALVTAVLTPLTVEAGEWFEKRVPKSSLLHEHEELGETMLYFALALALAALLLVFIHIREIRGREVTRVLSWVLAVVVVVISTATTVQVYRIGDSGAKATWGESLSE